LATDLAVLTTGDADGQIRQGHDGLVEHYFYTQVTSEIVPSNWPKIVENTYSLHALEFLRRIFVDAPTVCRPLFHKSIF
jgi:hypothetical protein